jgi:dTDP-glucose 4,6-dehydratase
MRVVVTGGCGFIGSNFVRHLLDTRDDVQVVVLDLLTYAGNLENLAPLTVDSRLTVERGDIADRELVFRVLEGCEAVVNFAAETHVDRSILEAAPFIRTNVVGTHVLLEVVRELKIPRLVQISTDEVYGSLDSTGRFTEASPLAPNSPYSASKAAGDMLVRAYVTTHRVPAVVVRASNAYGPYQFPEKLIPLIIANALAGEALPVYGDGLHVRDWVHVADLCDAIMKVLESGRRGEVYNVGGGNELTNIAVVREVLAILDRPASLIRFVPDRPGHDRRYAMDHGKISRELGWQPQRSFQEGLRETIRWYGDSQRWLESVRAGAYRTYYERQYGTRLADARTEAEPG